VLQKTPITFDVSVWELFWPLLEGATLVLAPPGAHRDPLTLAQLVADERITTMHFVPSMLRVFLEEPGVARTRGCLRQVVCSGEELPASIVARFSEVLPDVELHNLYGPTEASVDVTAWKCGPDDATAAPPIGRPVWNVCARVLDYRLYPVPVGVAGELYLSGVQLALGYHRRPGLTAERFLPDPWGPPGSRMYRTGDVVQRRQDGALVFRRRADHQIKLRGQRVELGEIEQLLQVDSSVAGAVVVVRNDRVGVAQLVAYVTGTAGGPVPDGPALIAHARAALPAVMVPEEVVVLDVFPLTMSGKLDRNALSASIATLSSAKQRLLAERRGRAVTARRGSLSGDARTKVLCDLFARLLGLDSVGPEDDFFRLGGDSIGSIRLVSMARRAGFEFSERMVFEYRTPRLLAAAAAALTSQAVPDAVSDNGTGVIPLTPIMHWWREGGGPTIGFHQSVLLDLPLGTGQHTLIAVLRALAGRHDLLRARLTMNADGEEVLSVPPPSAVDVATWFTRVDAREPGDEEAFVTSIAKGAASRLDPTRGMVVAVQIDYGNGRHGRLLLVVHHLAVDGVSWRVLLDDVATAWDYAAAGRSVRLPEVGSSYRTWARQLVHEACRPARLAELDLWVRALNAPEPAFGRTLDRATDTVGSASEIMLELEAKHAEPLLSVVTDRFRAGADHVLLCALALAVRAWRNQRGTPSSLLRVMVESHGRHTIGSEFDLSRTVGWFTARYPATLDLTGIDTFPALRSGPAAAALKAVKEQLRALPDGGLGYGLLRYLCPETRQMLAALPEPTIAFNYLGRFRTGDATGHGNSVRLAAHASSLDGGVPDGTPLTSVLDVTVIAWEHRDGVRLRTTFTWAPLVLEESSVRELADLWMGALTALVGLADDPDAGGATASDVFVDMGQDELDALQLEIESDLGES
jgi:non-ribosomal peptide synthase protein (TIGR01720 family)